MREGTEKGRVEAVFEVGGLTELMKNLSEAGIEQCAGEDLIIRREITSLGKTRSFYQQPTCPGQLPYAKLPPS